MSEPDFNFSDYNYLKLPDNFYTKLKPSPVAMPELVILNEELAMEMGLDFSNMSQKDCAELLSGNKLPNGATPFSQAYAGHQFGHFTILGDGRAHLLGEHIAPSGKRMDVAFKGSGRTPYSRQGDGRAALGPMLREYIISEAMHALGIPTTRSLAVVMTGEHVIREIPLPGAILTRVAASHIRVGTFEYIDNQGNDIDLKLLCDYTINRHYPEIKAGNIALEFLEKAMVRQVELMVHWMRVGFIHGVMNTDNMLVSGETIDYGPCAFMDQYDPNTVFSSIDYNGRYAYANQPIIAQWNLCRLAETLIPLIDKDRHKAVQLASKIINQFPKKYQMKQYEMMCSKIGLVDKMDGDNSLISDLFVWMQKTKADYTNTFCDLSYRDAPPAVLEQDKIFMNWYQRWRKRLHQSESLFEDAQLLMRKNNPTVIPRNHQVEKVIDAATEGNFKPLNQLMSVLKTPYINTESLQPYQQKPAPGEQVYQTFCGT